MRFFIFISAMKYFHFPSFLLTEDLVFQQAVGCRWWKHEEEAKHNIWAKTVHRGGLLIHSISCAAFVSQISRSPRQNLELLPWSRILIAGLCGLVTSNSPRVKQASTVLSWAAGEFRFSLTLLIGINPNYFTIPTSHSYFNLHVSKNSIPFFLCISFYCCPYDALVSFCLGVFDSGATDS